MQTECHIDSRDEAPSYARTFALTIIHDAPPFILHEEINNWVEPQPGRSQSRNGPSECLLG
jgi:hypothetical protein